MTFLPTTITKKAAQESHFEVECFSAEHSQNFQSTIRQITTEKRLDPYELHDYSIVKIDGVGMRP